MRATAIKLARRLLGVLDPALLTITGLLFLYALVVLGSATHDFPSRFQAHIVNTIVALLLMLAVAQIPPQKLMRLAPPVYLFGLLLLIAVALFGEVSKGARRWLDLGVTRIQPSEMMKIAVPMMLAWYFQRREGVLRIRDFLFATAILCVPLALIVRQPDLGTAVLVLAAGFFVLFFAGLSWKLIIPASLVGLAGIVALIGFGGPACESDAPWPGLKDYQKHRICMLLDPSADPLGRGFHTIQATIAVGSGGVLGKGWLKGTQTHLEFIPERHTDFVFAVLAEEFGLAGIVVLLALYLALIGRGLAIALNASSLFARLLAGSITMMFFTYAFVNMGMVTGILPVVGVPLPFLSYGGTALVTLCLGLGMLMSIQRHRALLPS